MPPKRLSCDTKYNMRIVLQGTIQYLLKFVHYLNSIGALVFETYDIKLLGLNYI